MAKKHKEIVKDIVEGMKQANLVAKGEMPVGTQVTFTLTEMLQIDNVKYPPGRYRIRKLA